MTDKDGTHARILEITITADESDNSLEATAIKFYRSRESLIQSNGYTVPFSGGAAAANCEIELGIVLPPPSVIRLKSTFQA